MLEDRPLEFGGRELAEVSRVLSSVFAGFTHLTPGYLAWSYCENPVGSAVGRNAWDGERLAAHYVTLPLRARLFGAEARGVLSLHTATDPAYQGQGLFTRLAEATYADAAAAGYDFVVGVANASSTPGFVRKLGFQLVSPLDVRIGLGSPPPPSAAAQGPCFERLWDENELEWRFGCPARAYRRTAGAGGFTVYAPTGRFGIWVELVSLPAEECIAQSALGKLPRLGVQNPVRLWMGLDGSREWFGRPWLPLPEFARPSPLNLIYRDLREPGRTLDPAHVRFSAIDFDAY